MSSPVLTSLLLKESLITTLESKPTRVAFTKLLNQWNLISQWLTISSLAGQSVLLLVIHFGDLKVRLTSQKSTSKLIRLLLLLKPRSSKLSGLQNLDKTLVLITTLMLKLNSQAFFLSKSLLRLTVRSSKTLLKVLRLPLNIGHVVRVDSLLATQVLRLAETWTTSP